MAKKINVVVLMGGKSPEHEISLMSGREIVKNLNPRKYKILPVVVSRGGNLWQIGEAKDFLDSPASKLKKNNKSKALVSVQQDPLSAIKSKNAQLVFIAMHGPYGEDGTVQGMLELIGIPYTGSKVLASSLGMDKIYSRKLFTQIGLNVPKYILISKGNKLSKIWKTLKPPVFVKPRNQGSSVGTSRVNREKDLPGAIKTALEYSDEAIIEEFLDGTEVTCAVLGNKIPKALPLIEIVPKKEFFDLEAKYNANLTDEICPARVSDGLSKKAQEAAVKAYQALGCQGFGRVDMIIVKDKVYVLEVNTIPGLTPVSLFPKAAKAAGISYSQLLDKIISLALGN